MVPPANRVYAAHPRLRFPPWPAFVAHPNGRHAPLVFAKAINSSARSAGLILADLTSKHSPPLSLVGQIMGIGSLHCGVFSSAIILDAITTCQAPIKISSSLHRDPAPPGGWVACQNASWLGRRILKSARRPIFALFFVLQHIECQDVVKKSKKCLTCDGEESTLQARVYCAFLVIFA